MGFTEISYALSNSSPALLTLGAVGGILFWKNLDVFHRNILLYLILMLLVELSGRLLGEIYNNNLIVLPLFSLIEMIFFLYFYNKFLFIKPNKLIMVAGILAILFIVGETLQYFVFNTLDTKQYQPYAKVIDNFVIIIMALYFFYQKINNFNETRWGNFRLNTAILIVFTFNSLVFLPFNFLINESSGIRFYFWTGNLLLLVFFYIYLISLIYINGRANRKIVR